MKWRQMLQHPQLEKALSLSTVVALSMILSAIAIKAVGESPLNVFKILGTSAFGSIESLSYTLFYATPLILTGLAVAVPLQAGLFNIGAEGQLYMGAVAATTWGIFSLRWMGADSNGVGPSIFLIGATWFGAALASFLGGAAWAGFAAYLRTKRQTHEVIATIMLNFIALAISNWMILYPLKNPETQSLETKWIPEALRLPHLWQHTTYGLPFALGLAFFVLWAVQKTWWGYRVRVAGQNSTAAEIAGIAVTPTLQSAMILGGGLAGLVGFNEVYGHSYRLIDGFSSQLGFTGIAIALLARANPWALITAALFFGGLHKGTLDLDLETEKITRDLSYIIQALVLLVLAAQPAITKLIQRKVQQCLRLTK